MKPCHRGISLAIFLSSVIAASQPLDWSSDLTIFGTSANEHHPAITTTPADGLLRAFCVKDSGRISSKLSEDLGVSWSTFDDLSSGLDQQRLKAVADGSHIYAMVCGIGSPTRTAYRFASASNDWSSAHTTLITPARTAPLTGFGICTDYSFRPNDPYINVCWAEYDAAAHVFTGVFAQSRDLASTFLPEHFVFSQTRSAITNTEIEITVAGDSAQQRLLLAAPLDRAGNLPAEIRVFVSEDQGVTWSAGIAIDPSEYIQDEPNLESAGSVIILVYTLRQTQSGARDIYLSYSPDGGLNFSPHYSAFDSPLDEGSPRIAIDPAAGLFYLFCLAGEIGGDEGAVFLRQGLLNSPWDLSDTLRVSGNDHVILTDGLDATNASAGVAAVWSSRFELGDTDIRFDASWRGTPASDRRNFMTTGNSLEQNFPNPFNGATILPLTVNRAGEQQLLIIDILGRQVMRLNQTFTSPGSQNVLLNLSPLPSGVYFAKLQGSKNNSFRRMSLVK
jgi:hypothetical protein